MKRVKHDLDAKIRRHGWAMLHVSGPLMDSPDWTYSVGLSRTHDLPELIVFGLGQHHGAEVLDTVRDRLVVAPDLAVAGTLLGPASDVPGSPSLRLIDVAPIWKTTYPLATVERYGRDVAMLQVVVDSAPQDAAADPGVELARLAAQPHLDDPVDPWPVPVHPVGWFDDLSENVDLWVACPITAHGEPEHRREVVPARWVTEDTARLVAPPMLADDLNAGALVRVERGGSDELALPHVMPSRPVHHLGQVVQPSDRIHLTFHRAPTEAAFAAIERIIDRFRTVLGTFGSQSLHVAVPPADATRFRAAMRVLERDGHVLSAASYHAPAEVSDHHSCVECLAARPDT